MDDVIVHYRGSCTEGKVPGEEQFVPLITQNSGVHFHPKSQPWFYLNILLSRECWTNSAW